MNRALPITCLLAVSACTTPDVATTLSQARTEFTAFSEGIDPQIARNAAAERTRQEQRAIAADKAVISFVGDCDTFAEDAGVQVLSTCEIVEHFDPLDDAGDASEVMDFLAIMDGYLASLEALVASNSASEAQTQANAIVAAFGMPDAARPAAFERLGASLRDRQTLISTSTRFIVNQVRINALRRAMADADAVLEVAIPLVVAELDPFETERYAAQARFDTAQLAIVDVEGQGNPAAYAAAITEARAAHAAFKQAEANSPVIKLLQFRQTHARLLAMTRPGADATEFVEYLEELRALYDAVNEET